VLLNEILEQLTAKQPQFVVDCTLGGAGHAESILHACPKTYYVGIDRDPQALAYARDRLQRFHERVQFIHARFSTLPQVLKENNRLGAIDVLLCDLGVSSHQIDSTPRGFSWRTPGPLDMRMNQASGMTALEYLENVDEETLTRMLFAEGEERYAKRIARNLLARRRDGRLPQTTVELANLVHQSVPKRHNPHHRSIDPATRTFQALRRVINHEHQELEILLKEIPNILSDCGRALVISFHSLEDRLVKLCFTRAENPCTCPRNLPVCVCHQQPTLKRITRDVIKPSEKECEVNPRARSSRLRIAERLPRNSGVGLS